jgi:hypothetical protein
VPLVIWSLQGSWKTYQPQWRLHNRHQTVKTD